ncbi:hypothetical protein ACEQ8H_006557 [Pleosporales sp. CAS-2024a]
MSTQQTHNVVIVGANFGGISLAHYLLRKTFPSLKTLQPQTTFHVTLVSPNTHFYFKIAAPRALISAESIPEDQYFKSIAEAFQQYHASAFEFIQGIATSVDAQARTVSVKVDSDSTDKVITYDSLVIASGTTSSSPLWSIKGSHETSREALHAMHQELPKASTVLIAGAGPVGVETAGEIKFAFPDVKVTLVTSSRILPRESPNLGAKAKAALEKLGVMVKTDLPLSDPMADDKARPVQFSDGSSESPDIFINATGASKINTEWLPSSWLAEDKKVATRDNHFRVKDSEHVYVIGDAASGSNGTAFAVEAMTPVVASCIAVDVTGSAGTNDGLMAWFFSFFKTPAPRQADYKPMNVIVIPIGPKGGVGHLFGWGMPSFMVKKVKAEKYLIDHVEPMLSGKKWA